MKNLLRTFILFVMAFSITYVYAQSVNFGVRAGINLANVEVEGFGVSSSADLRVGVVLGAFADIGISENFSVQPELQFIQKGFKNNDNDDKLLLNYLEVPVLAKYSFGAGATRGFVQAGPSFGFALSSNAESGGVKEDIDFDQDGVKRGDVGLTFGAGVDFGAIFIDFRYTLGLSKWL